MALSTTAQLKALADPLRYRVFEQLTSQSRTAKQMAEILGTKPTRLYHHFKVLERAGLIERTATRRTRGTTEKYFRAVADRIALDPSVLGKKKVSLSSVYAGALRSTMEELVDAERIVRTSHRRRPTLFLKRLKFKTTHRAVQRLRRSLEASLDEVQPGDEDYAVTVVLYPVSEESRRSEK